MVGYRELADLLRAAAVNWVRDYAQSMGAALAFYTMFPIAPLLLIVVSVAGLFVGEEAARGEIYSQLDGMLGAQGALAVHGLLETAGRPAGQLLPGVIGLVVLFVGATSVPGKPPLSTVPLGCPASQMSAIPGTVTLVLAPWATPAIVAVGSV